MKIIWFVIPLLILASCSSGEPIECESAAQCAAASVCSTPICTPEGKCSQIPSQNCCGNLICEDGENVCSCSEDCSFPDTESGECSGQVQIPYAHAPDRTFDADFAQYYCDNDECIVGVPDDEIQEIQLFSNHGGSIELDIVTTLSKPYVSNKGTFSVRVTLVDINEQFARGPVTITKLQVTSGNELVGEKSLNNQLSQIGTSFETDVALSPALREIEEDRTLQLKMHYEFFNYNSFDDSTTLQRTSLQTSYQSIPFINPN